jgi:hypothetical protein
MQIVTAAAPLSNEKKNSFPDQSRTPKKTTNPWGTTTDFVPAGTFDSRTRCAKLVDFN